MSQHFSNLPRDFLHQNVNQNHPVSLNGGVKRLDEKQNTQGNWNKFMERTDDFQILRKPENQHQYRQQKEQNYESSRRIMQPEYNIEQEKPNQKKIIQNCYKSRGYNSGNIMTLLDKQEQQEQQVSRKKQFGISSNEQTVQDDKLNLQKHWEKKQQEYQYSAIYTLPGQVFKEKNYEIEKVEDNCKLQKMMNLRSEIDTIPGQQTCKRISKELDNNPEPNKDLYYIKFQHNTAENCPQERLPENSQFKKKNQNQEYNGHCNNEYIVSQYENQQKQPSYKNQQTSAYQQQKQEYKNTVSGHRKGLSGQFIHSQTFQIL